MASTRKCLYVLQQEDLQFIHAFLAAELGGMQTVLDSMTEEEIQALPQSERDFVVNVRQLLAHYHGVNS